MTMNKRANIAYLISLYCKMTSKLAQEGGWNGKNLETVICCVNAPAGPERSIPMDGKRFLALLTLLIGTHACAQPKDDFATAMLAADRHAPLASVQKVEAILTTQGGHVASVSSTGSIVQARFPAGEWVYAVLEHADSGAPLQAIVLFCHTISQGATALCQSIAQRYNADK